MLRRGSPTPLLRTRFPVNSVAMRSSVRPLLKPTPYVYSNIPGGIARLPLDKSQKPGTFPDIDGILYISPATSDPNTIAIVMRVIFKTSRDHYCNVMISARLLRQDASNFVVDRASNMLYYFAREGDVYRLKQEPASFTPRDREVDPSISLPVTVSELGDLKYNPVSQRLIWSDPQDVSFRLSGKPPFLHFSILIVYSDSKFYISNSQYLQGSIQQLDLSLSPRSVKKIYQDRVLPRRIAVNPRGTTSTAECNRNKH